MHNVAQLRLVLGWIWLARIAVRFVMWKRFRCWSVDFVSFQTVTYLLHIEQLCI